MLAVAARSKRENLFQEISETVRQWPVRERQIFAQAHYQGQSQEAISASLQIDPAEVRAILNSCERRLHSSLRRFRKGNSEKSSHVSAETPRPAFCAKAANPVQALTSKAGLISDIYRKSA
jgi:hypothetical protein